MTEIHAKEVTFSPREIRITQHSINDDDVRISALNEGMCWMATRYATKEFPSATWRSNMLEEVLAEVVADVSTSSQVNPLLICVDENEIVVKKNA